MAVFGIDFGNLNSVVSVARRGGVDVILNEVSKRETPTIVSFGEKERYIGEKGLDMSIRNWKNTVHCLKRLIGVQYDTPAANYEKKFLKCEMRPDENGFIELKVRYKFDEHWFKPEQLVGALFGKLRQYVEREQAEELAAAKVSASNRQNQAPTAADCVVSAPAYYTITQRRLLWQALQISGLNPLNIICETTAAALDYGIFRNASLPEKAEDAVVVAFVDFGHSATSASLVSFTKGQLKVLGHVFDRFCGCRDFDYALFEHFGAEVEKKYHCDLSEDRKGSLKLMASCEKLKKMLSANSLANFSCEMGEFDVSFPTVKREDCEALWQPLLQRTRDLLHKLQQIPGYDRLSAVEIVGGGSRMGCIKTILNETFSVPISTTLNASESTAKGCAIMSAMLSPKFKVREFSVIDSNVYTINLGYHSEKSTAVIDPAFPEINKKMVVLKPGDACPKTLNLTFDRSNDFDLYVFYEKTDDIDSITNQLLIGKWKVGKIPTTVENPAVKVRLRLNPSMLVHVEGASVAEEIEVEEEEEVEVPVEDTPQDKPADGAADGTEPMETDKKDDKEKKEEKKDEKPKTKKVKQMVKKKKTHKHECQLVPLTSSGNSQEKVNEFLQAEKDMTKSDTNIKETQEAKNNVESYIYEMRSKVDGGELTDFIAADIKQNFLKLLTATEDWLYGEGEDTAKDDYTQKLSELQKIGGPPATRYQEEQGLPSAINTFNTKAAELRSKAENTDGSRSHIPEDELKKALNKCDELIKLTQEEKAKQDGLAKSADRVLLITTVNSRARELENFCNPILNKPKPKEKPKKEEEKPKEDAKKEEGADKKEGEAAEKAADKPADAPQDKMELD
eukprot:TRINITY_DN60213_c0_g1_i1.p1 TRINITY_DN60213_c0_g1~~TRINITY_DN60213_c0_g1_i1.p1  ORF type:complete len:848 (-),score=168.98 TRINITY_DN60213_c0_g1_i1:161-2704(-)